MAEAQRVEIGFEGGQVIAARLADDDLKDLRKHHQDNERKINSDRRFTTMSSRLDHCSGEIETKLKDMKKILEALGRENR